MGGRQVPCLAGPSKLMQLEAATSADASLAAAVRAQLPKRRRRSAGLVALPIRETVRPLASAPDASNTGSVSQTMLSVRDLGELVELAGTFGLSSVRSVTASAPQQEQERSDQKSLKGVRKPGTK